MKPANLIFIAAASCLWAGTARADLVANFDSSTDGWTGSLAPVSVTWTNADGFPDGSIRACGNTNEAWHLVSPPGWGGDWSSYKLIKWDMKIGSGGYPDAQTNAVMMIKGANGSTLTWLGPAPIWTWSHYEVLLQPAYFGASQSEFESVVTNVESLLIVGEYQAAVDETIALDSVHVTSNPPAAHSSLVSTFSADSEGWRAYDDVTLSWAGTGGNPGGFLYGDDWAIGQVYRFATPLSWAGDWRGLTLLTFDLRWVESSAASSRYDMVWIRGANGKQLAWNSTGPANQWTHYGLWLAPENFGVTQAEFDAVMSHVTEMLILGEFFAGDEHEGLDNVVLTNFTPSVVSTDLVSTFNTDAQGWTCSGDGAASWQAEGTPGGSLLGVDQGAGIAWYFRSPTNWAGDWRQLTHLQFNLRSVAGFSSRFTNALVSIHGMNGATLTWSGLTPNQLWTHYSIPVTPESFGVEAAVFEGVMRYVVSLEIHGEFGSDLDRAALDSFGLYRVKPAAALPDREVTFEADAEGWHNGFTGVGLSWISSGGNPGGFLQGTDSGGDIWHFVSPGSWVGDWRHYRSLRFDHRVGYGASSSWPSPNFYVLGANTQTLSQYLHDSSGTWARFEADLSPVAFGVDQTTYDGVMANVIAVFIRGEYVDGYDIEALDNVRLSHAPLGVSFDRITREGGDIAFWLTTQSGTSYQLQQRTNLVTGDWEDISGKIITGDGNTNAFVVPLAPATDCRWFRFRSL